MPGATAERPALTSSLETPTATPFSQAGPTNARADPLPDPRFIKNKRSGGSALMKQFFPGDDEDELPDVKPAASRSGPAGWQRIDGGPTRKDIDVPSEHSQDAKHQAEACPVARDEISEKTQSAPATLPSATPMDVDSRGTAPEHDSTGGPPVEPLSPTPNGASPNASIAQAPPLLSNRNSQRLTTSPTSTAANAEDGHASRKSKPNQPAATMPRDGEIYTIVSQVGEGTFGQVYKAVNTHNNSRVALKRIRMEGEKDGFPVTAMREIKLLQSLSHENVVKLHEMMVSKSALFRFRLHFPASRY
jgi:hypothetical protein